MPTIKLQNKKIIDLLLQKDVLVNSGRKISEEIELVEDDLAKNDTVQREITTTIEPVELITQGRQLQETINTLLTELDIVGDQIMDAKLSAIPQEIKDEYFTLKTKKENLERDRNKIALKVQKIKDKVVPLVKKEVKPLLGEYEDIETATVEDNEVHIETFSHLEHWKETFAKKK